MAIERDSRDIDPTPVRLHRLAKTGVLSVKALERALQITGHTPDAAHMVPSQVQHRNSAPRAPDKRLANEGQA
jgi:hypothetical protein